MQQSGRSGSVHDQKFGLMLALLGALLAGLLFILPGPSGAMALTATAMHDHALASPHNQSSHYNSHRNAPCQGHCPGGCCHSHQHDHKPLKTYCDGATCCLTPHGDHPAGLASRAPRLPVPVHYADNDSRQDNALPGHWPSPDRITGLPCSCRASFCAPAFGPHASCFITAAGQFQHVIRLLL